MEVAASRSRGSCSPDIGNQDNGSQADAKEAAFEDVLHGHHDGFFWGSGVLEDIEFLHSGFLLGLNGKWQGLPHVSHKLMKIGPPEGTSIGRVLGMAWRGHPDESLVSPLWFSNHHNQIPQGNQNTNAIPHGIGGDQEWRETEAPCSLTPKHSEESLCTEIDLEHVLETLSC